MKVTSRGENRWKRFNTFAVAMLLLLTGSCLFAASRFDSFVGFDGLVPNRGWYPITCELQNDGPAFNAVIEVSPQQMGRGQSRKVALDLPTGTLKRVVIPVFTTAATWNVRVLDDRGKVRDEQTTTPARVMPAELPLVAGLCRTVQGLPAFPDMPGHYQSGPAMPFRAARLEPGLFPDNPIAMESIDLLYINSQKALELSEPQVTALIAWLQNGGQLVVGVEQISDITGSHWLKDLMPCDLTAVRSMTSHPELQDWFRVWPGGIWNAPILRPPNLQRRGGPPVNGSANSMAPNQPPNSGGSPAPLEITEDPQFEGAALPVAIGTMGDGEVLIGSADAPLAVSAARGRGRITVLTFSPEREPFLSWKNRPYFWAKLAGISRERITVPPDQVNMANLSSDGIFGSMIDSKQVRKLPLGWLLLLLVAYLGVIGPLDQYWLKKINRQMLTWITFPFYVVAFSGLIYLIGFHLRAGELEWSEINVVDVLPGEERAVLRGETYVSIYSPVNASYQLESSQPYATLRGEAAGYIGSGQESSDVSVLQIGNHYRAEASVPVWTSQLFVGDWLQGVPASPVEMTAQRSTGGDWSATVVNNLETKLTHARAVLGNRVFDLGDLAPHQTNTFALTTEQGTPVSAFASQYVDIFRAAVQQRHQSFGNNVVGIPDIVGGAMAASFLSVANGGSQPMNNFTIYQNLDLARFAGGDHGILLAWDEGHSLVDGLNNFTAKRLHRDSLLRLVVPVKSSGSAAPDTNPHT